MLFGGQWLPLVMTALKASTQYYYLNLRYSKNLLITFIVYTETFENLELNVTKLKLNRIIVKLNSIFHVL